MQYPISLIGAPNALGISPGDPIELTFKLRGSSSVAGDVLMQDFLGTQITADSVTPSAVPGVVGSIWHNTSAPTAFGVTGSAGAPFFAVCRRDVADLGEYPGVVYGFVQQVFVFLSTGGTSVFGTSASPVSAKNLDLTPTTGTRLNAVVYVAVTGTGSRQLAGPTFVNFVGNLGAGGIQA